MPNVFNLNVLSSVYLSNCHSPGNDSNHSFDLSSVPWPINQPFLNAYSRTAEDSVVEVLWWMCFLPAETYSRIMTWNSPLSCVLQCYWRSVKPEKYQYIPSPLLFPESWDYCQTVSSPEWPPCFAMHHQVTCFDIQPLYNHIDRFLSVS